MIDCKTLLFIIVILGLLLLLKKSNKFSGGATEKTTNIKAFETLEKMIISNNLTDEQVLEKLQKLKTEKEDIVKKKQNIYNNLLTNLSATDDEIETAELNLEDAKNNLLLANINLELKSSIIVKKNNKIKEKNKLFGFYVELNRVKQYNLYTLILMSKIRKLRQNTKIAPNNKTFKTDLLNNVKNTLEFAKVSYEKTNDLYKKIISSDHPKIINYKSDMSNSKNISKELKDNLEKIKNRLINKEKMDKEIKDKLLASQNEEIKEVQKEEASLFDSLSTLFRSF